MTTPLRATCRRCTSTWARSDDVVVGGDPHWCGSATFSQEGI